MMAPATNDISANLLLALAKDERYVEEARKTLDQILESLSLSDNNELAPWIVSASLYLLLSTLRGRNQTLGMASTGLDFADGKSRRLLRLAAVLGLMTAGASIWSRRRRHGDGDQATSTGSGSNVNNNNLRGSQRLQAFEDQRRRMMERAQLQQEQEGLSQIQRQQQQQQDNESNGDSPHGESRVSPTARMIVAKLQNIGYKAARSIISALSSCANTGPHDMLSNSGGNAFSMGVWLIRMRMALVCLGVHPWMQPSKGPSLVNSRENSLRLAGILILCHGAGQVARYVSRAWVKRAVQKRLQAQMELHQQESDVAGATTPATQDRLNNDTSVMSCAICQEPRRHPACSVKCGHVLCWKCWQLWVGNKAECPVCRTACRPQDILPLENYSVTVSD